MLQFSWCKVPEHLNFDVNDNPNHDGYEDLGNKLAANRPMLSCVFHSKDEMPPTVSQMHKVMREEYVNSSADPQAHETYGLLLDTLRRLHINKLRNQEMYEGATESSTAQSLELALNMGALIADREFCCMLYLTQVDSFEC